MSKNSLHDYRVREMCSFTQVKNDNCGALLLFGLVELEMNFADYLTTDRSELEELIPLICYNGRAGKSLSAELYRWA